MTLAIVLASIAVYLAGWLPAARRRYRQVRPYTEPLNCRGREPGHQHGYPCYRRAEFPAISFESDAIRDAAIRATFWPVLAAASAVTRAARAVSRVAARAIVAGGRQDPAELTGPARP